MNFHPGVPSWNIGYGEDCYLQMEAAGDLRDAFFMCGVSRGAAITLTLQIGGNTHGRYKGVSETCGLHWTDSGQVSTVKNNLFLCSGTS